jgi:hypothetical protein
MVVQHRVDVLAKLAEGMKDFNSDGAHPVHKEAMDTKEDGIAKDESEAIIDGLGASTPTINIKNEDATSPPRVSASPHPIRSPNRLPPVGTFSVTTPDRHAS